MSFSCLASRRFLTESNRVSDDEKFTVKRRKEGGWFSITSSALQASCAGPVLVASGATKQPWLFLVWEAQGELAAPWPTGTCCALLLTVLLCPCSTVLRENEPHSNSGAFCCPSPSQANTEGLHSCPTPKSLLRSAWERTSLPVTCPGWAAFLSPASHTQPHVHPLRVRLCGYLIR